MFTSNEEKKLEAKWNLERGPDKYSSQKVLVKKVDADETPLFTEFYSRQPQRFIPFQPLAKYPKVGPLNVSA